MINKTKLVFLCLILLLAIHLLILINTKFTVWPEMMLYPWLLNNGFELYKDIINPYFPLLTIVLSFFFKLFGASILGLKIFTYTIVIISDLTVFYLAYKLSKKYYRSLFALLIYVLLQFSYGGNELWFELVLTPLVLLGTTILYINSKKRLYVLFAGIFLGLAFLTKQNAVLFYIPCLILLLFYKQYKSIIFLLLPGLVFWIITFLYFIKANLFQDFYFWSVLLTLTYTSQPGFIYLTTLKQYPIMLFPIISFFGYLTSKQKNINKLYFALCFLIGLSFNFPRNEDFHLQILVAFSALFTIFLPLRYLIIFLLIVLIIFSKSFVQDFHKEDRFLDREMYRLSEKIEGYDSVYLLNSPELAYFIANKLPPGLWATNFPWYFEQAGFQERFINNLKEEKTQYVVIGSPIGGKKYDLGNYLPDRVMEYITKSYTYKEKFGNYQIWQINTSSL